jgi:hypothetical protein
MAKLTRRPFFSELVFGLKLRHIEVAYLTFLNIKKIGFLGILFQVIQIKLKI